MTRWLFRIPCALLTVALFGLTVHIVTNVWVAGDAIEGNCGRRTLDRLDSFVGGMAGKRLTYAELIQDKGGVQ